MKVFRQNYGSISSKIKKQSISSKKDKCFVKNTKISSEMDKYFVKNGEYSIRQGKEFC